MGLSILLLFLSPPWVVYATLICSASCAVRCHRPCYLGSQLTKKGLIAVTKTTHSCTLLLTSLGVLKWTVLQTIPARAGLTALNFCQPFLINRAIRLSQEAIDNGTTQVGYGLIGAYFLVYVGIAVRRFPPSL